MKSGSEGFDHINKEVIYCKLLVYSLCKLFDVCVCYNLANSTCHQDLCCWITVQFCRSFDQNLQMGIWEFVHRLFLLGLKKYGKGDWRNISRNYVVTRTPTQVASHAQKYFIRQLSGGKDKRRASIHDITTVNVTENHNPLPKNKRTSPEQCKIPWNQSNSGAGAGGTAMAFNQTNGNLFISPRYNGGFRMGGGGGGGLHEFYGAPQSMVFQMQPATHYPHG